MRLAQPVDGRSSSEYNLHVLRDSNLKRRNADMTAYEIISIVIAMITLLIASVTLLLKLFYYLDSRYRRK